MTPDSGAEAVTTKGPIEIPEEHKEFIEGIWLVIYTPNTLQSHRDLG